LTYYPIRRYDERTRELELIRTSYHQQSSLHLRSALDEGVNGQVARERNTILIRDTRNPPPDVVSAQLADQSIRSLLIVPIKVQDRYYGNLGLGHEEVNFFTSSDVSFFEGLALQLAVTISRLENMQESQEFKRRALDAEKMSSVGQIAFQITHRWENDLGLVESYVEDIRAELEQLHVSNAFVQGKLEKIVRSARKVLDLSGELKRAVSGEILAEEPTFIHPALLIQEVLQELAERLTVYVNVQIHNTVLEESSIAEVHVYRQSVTDILHNLVSNALDALPEGGRITLSAQNLGQFVAFDVTDTGKGISPQVAQRIFDMFYSTKGSSGFGLWSARMKALKNQGDLKVSSEQEQGTTFTLLLPKKLT